MKTIDICDNEFGGGTLKIYYDSINDKSHEIFFTHLFLSIGDISTIKNHLKFLKKLEFENYGNVLNCEETLKIILNVITPETKVRIWSSKKDTDFYLSALYFCNVLKSKTEYISVINSESYDNYLLNVKNISSSQIDNLIRNEKILSTEEIDLFSKEWEKIKNENGDIRTFNNGKITNKKFIDFDNDILNKLKILNKCSIIQLVYELIKSKTIDNQWEVIYKYLIDSLIERNKIFVVNKFENHLYDEIIVNE